MCHQICRCWKLCMLHFHAERKTKYAIEGALRLQFQFATLQPNLVHQLIGEICEYPWWQRAQPAL